MATFPATIIPSYGSSLKQQPKIIEIKFGDGYEQSTLMGINTDPEEWRLRFDNMSSADVDTIVSFFLTYNTATTPFDWTPPDGVEGQYKCRSWSRTYDGAGHEGLSCTFSEVFWG